MKNPGIFAACKPKGLSSNQFLEKLRQAANVRKIGHAGTLDPLASGILVIGAGRKATKKLPEITAKEKEYLATVRLGAVSLTDDAEGPIKKSANYKIPNREKVKTAVEKFKGKIKQVPPQYSAVKIKGKEAYKHARQGRYLSISPRQVEIKNIKITSYRWPSLRLKATTGPGVYIRALARDIGNELKTGAYLEKLERTRVGSFDKNSAISFKRAVKLCRKYANG